jgi:hypothetical protein
VATNNRSDIAIETAEAIETLLAKNEEDNSLALLTVRTFIAAHRLITPPKMGRPRKPKAEA